MAKKIKTAHPYQKGTSVSAAEIIRTAMKEFETAHFQTYENQFVEAKEIALVQIHLLLHLSNRGEENPYVQSVHVLILLKRISTMTSSSIMSPSSHLSVHHSVRAECLHEMYVKSFVRSTPLLTFCSPQHVCSECLFSVWTNRRLLLEMLPV